MEERACQLALYLIENRATVRAAAGKFGVSKSTVHKDLSERLPAYNRALYLQVKEVLDENKAQRHIRGGLATRRQYKGRKSRTLYALMPPRWGFGACRQCRHPPPPERNRGDSTRPAPRRHIPPRTHSRA